MMTRQSVSSWEKLLAAAIHCRTQAWYNAHRAHSTLVKETLRSTPDDRPLPPIVILSMATALQAWPGVNPLNPRRELLALLSKRLLAFRAMRRARA